LSLSKGAGLDSIEPGNVEDGQAENPHTCKNSKDGAPNDEFYPLEGMPANTVQAFVTFPSMLYCGLGSPKMQRAVSRAINNSSSVGMT
jgi:hypothetical protein